MVFWRKEFFKVSCWKKDENTGADFIRGQIKTTSVKTVLLKLVLVYFAWAKDRKFIIRKISLLISRESIQKIRN